MESVFSTLRTERLPRVIFRENNGYNGGNNGSSPFLSDLTPNASVSDRLPDLFSKLLERGMLQ